MLQAEAVAQAARRIAPHVRRTPILRLWNGLGLKAESLQPTGSFKLRGAFNTLLGLTATQRARGVVAHSSGNHALAVAWAASQLGVAVVLVMPDDAPRAKVAGVLRCGAEIVVVGPSSSERSARAQALAGEHGYTLVEPYDSAAVIAATGTLGAEILEDAPDTEVVFAPVGGGGLISGLAATLKQLKPSIRVIGVEPEVAADAAESLKAGRVVTLPATQMARTIADGLRVQRIGARNWPLIRDHVDEVVTVSEAAIRAAMVRIADEACLLAEPSGAVAAAGALATGAAHPSWVAILSGGNLDLSVFAEAVRASEAQSGGLLC
jgi:threonine dehydratase